MADPPINPERWRRINEVLDQALELPPEELPAFLDRSCAGDADLRAAVEKLLAADRQAGDHGFLGSPAEETASLLLREDLKNSQKGEDGVLGPYRILRRLDSGGMGVVYLARDQRLQRTVALKVLPAGWGGGAEARERFLREARLISSLDHPNICTLHDLGETGDGRLYLVMAYYQGETLRSRLTRGPLPVDEAVDLAVQVGRGLARAHQAGIIHRDIKPGNVMVTAHGEAKILDFGIAKSVDETSLTRPGSTLGTPAYMSPEQAAGRPVDARTDVWSLGVLLYEMITGRRPFGQGTPPAQIEAILHTEPEPLDQGRSDLPRTLVRAVGKALAKDPGRRYSSVDDFLADLNAGTGPQAVAAAAQRRHWRTLAAAGLAAAVLLGLVGWNLRAPRGRPERGTAGVAKPVPSAVPVVGVLPFANRTGDAALDWYGEGLALLARDSLSSSRHLQVVSAPRVEPLAALRDEGERARRAAADGITVLLSGEILTGPGGLTLAARVVDTRSGRQLAARRFDGLAPKDLLQASDEIGLEARKALNVPPAESVDVFAADFATGNPEAYESYIQGLRAMADQHNDEAERYFSRALRQSPGFTMARYRLAQTLATTSRTDEALVEIRAALAEAGKLPDREARYVRAFEAQIDSRYDEAIQGYREIVEGYPYESEARYFLAALLKNARRYDEALGQLAILTRLEPQDANAWNVSGEAHLAQGDLQRAVHDFERLLALQPDSAEGRKLLGDAYRAGGEYAQAVESYSEALRLDPRLRDAAVALAVTEALRGERAAAEKRLEDVVADTSVAPRQRLDAAVELAWLSRSEGRFRRSAEVLADLEDVFVAERVREALALSVRGTSLLEAGNRAAARPLLERAVERSPGVATRYLFARGLLELEEGRLSDLEKTVSEILAGARPAGDPNRKEEKAAACLRGMRELRAGRTNAAIDELTRAAALKGYEYTIPKLWLARAYLAADRLPEALAAAQDAARHRDPSEPRLDLELDRARALLVQAQVQKALGRTAEATALASQFLARWQGADAGLPELATARRLAAG
ncbi:MAG TPA: protein kinase [Thermoanaerobaculia bacterium]